MDLVSMLISLVSGGAAGNLLGAAWKDKSLGAIGNSIAGAVGGAAGAYITQAMGILSAMGLADMTVNSMMGNVGSSAVGGAVLTAAAGIIKSMMAKK